MLPFLKVFNYFRIVLTSAQSTRSGIYQPHQKRELANCLQQRFAPKEYQEILAIVK